MIWSILYFSAASMMLSLPPTIGMPSIRRPHLLGLSSITQTGLAFASLDTLSSFRITSPAAPAPINHGVVDGSRIFFSPGSFRRINLYANLIAVTRQNWITAPKHIIRRRHTVYECCDANHMKQCGNPRSHQDPVQFAETCETPQTVIQSQHKKYRYRKDGIKRREFQKRIQVLLGYTGVISYQNAAKDRQNRTRL